MAGSASLRTLLAREGCLALPGIYDGISARVADSLGFEALYMTGYGAVASALGVADAGLATFTEIPRQVSSPPPGRCERRTRILSAPASAPAQRRPGCRSPR